MDTTTNQAGDGTRRCATRNPFKTIILAVMSILAAVTNGVLFLRTRKVEGQTQYVFVKTFDCVETGKRILKSVNVTVAELCARLKAYPAIENKAGVLFESNTSKYSDPLEVLKLATAVDNAGYLFKFDSNPNGEVKTVNQIMRSLGVREQSRIKDASHIHIEPSRTSEVQPQHEASAPCGECRSARPVRCRHELRPTPALLPVRRPVDRPHRASPFPDAIRSANLRHPPPPASISTTRSTDH